LRQAFLNSVLQFEDTLLQLLNGALKTDAGLLGGTRTRSRGRCSFAQLQRRGARRNRRGQQLTAVRGGVRRQFREAPQRADQDPCDAQERKKAGRAKNRGNQEQRVVQALHGVQLPALQFRQRRFQATQAGGNRRRVAGEAFFKFTPELFDGLRRGERARQKVRRLHFRRLRTQARVEFGPLPPRQRQNRRHKAAEQSAGHKWSRKQVLKQRGHVRHHEVSRDGRKAGGRCKAKSG
jgi:hypothetical protein